MNDNILEPNINGLPPVTDWQKVFLALQQANEAFLRGATLKEFGKQVIGDVQIQGADFVDLPVAEDSTPVALPIPETGNKFGFLAAGKFTQPTGSTLEYSSIHWGLVLFDGDKWVKKFTLKLPAGKDAEVENELGQSTTKAISQKVVTDLSFRVDNKVEKEGGKVLSENDYIASDKEKVDMLKADINGDENKFLNEKGGYKNAPEAIGTTALIQDSFNIESIANIGNTYVINKPNLEGREIVIYIEGPASAGNISVGQREGVGTPSVKTDEVPVNVPFKTTIYNNNITRFFVFKSNAPSGNYRVNISLVGVVDGWLAESIRKNKIATDTNATGLTTLSSRIDSNDVKIAAIDTNIKDEKINVINSLTTDAQNRLIGSIVFSKSGLGGRLVSVFVSSPNDAPMRLFQREGTTSKGNEINFRTNQLIYVRIFDNTIDRLFSYITEGVPPGTYTFTVNLIAVLNDKRITDNQVLEGKIDAVENAIDNIQIEASGIPADFQKTAYKFGNSVILDKLIGSSAQFKLFSALEPVLPQGNNLLYMKDKGNTTLNGSTYKIENKQIVIWGQATAQIQATVATFELPRGKYTFKGFVDGDVNNKLWNGLHIRIGAPNLANNENISSYDPIVYEVTAEKENIRIIVYSNASVVINGEAVLRVMVNKGIVSLPYDVPSEIANINFKLGNNFALRIGSLSTPITIPTSYGLAAIPVLSTATTLKESDIATYSNALGNCFIADSLEYNNGVITHVKRIGVKKYQNGDTIAAPYLSKNVLGLVDGYDVYYVLQTPVSTVLKSISPDINSGIKIDTDSAGAYFYCTYNTNKNFVETPIALTRAGLTEINPNGWGRGSAAIDGKNIYIGGQFGVLEKIDATVEPAMSVVGNTVLDPENIIRGLIVNGNYLYAIDRDPTAATPTNTTNIGNLFVLNKETLAVVNRLYLRNKGCGLGIYNNYLYVMEQMWNFQVFNISNPASPVLVYTYEGDYRFGEFQNCTFWGNGGQDYFAVASFEQGVQFFNITNPAAPVRVGSAPPKFNVDGDGSMQVFDVAINFPYLHYTIAPNDAGRKYAKGAYRGIITIDISDLSIYSNDAPVSNYHASLIPYESWSPHLSEGDLHPNRMKKLGDVIITNNGRWGLAVFRIKNNIPVFESNIRFGSYGTAGAQTQALAISDDGRLAIGGYAKNTVAGNKQYAYLYRVANVNFDY